MQRKYAELNKVAIFRHLRATKDMRIKHYSKSFKHVKDGILLYSSPENPVYMFAKNYSKGKSEKRYSLFVYTYESDRAIVEKQLDDIAKSVKNKDIVEIHNNIKSFNYIADLVQ